MIMKKFKYFYDACFLVLYALVFAIYFVRREYTPDYFIQLSYLDQVDERNIDIVRSLLNNSFVLDYIFWGLHKNLGIGSAVILQWFYVVVFGIKYVLLVQFSKSRVHVLIIFLWGFYSLDLNQIRLNISFLFFICLSLGGNRLISLAAMAASHLTSAVLFPIPAAVWIGGYSRLKVILLMFLLAVGVTWAAVNVNLSMDDRFFYYLETDDFWIPKALLACPIMLYVVRGQFDRPSRIVFILLALLPLAAASLKLALVAARFMEMIYMAFLIKIALSREPLSRTKNWLLATPAVLMFGFRAVLGIHSGS